MITSGRGANGATLRRAGWVGALLFALYLLTFSGRFHVMDEMAVFTAGHNLAAYGRADIDPLIWTNHWTPDPPGVWGVDGNLYTKKAPGISLLVAALLRLAAKWDTISAVHVGLLSGALLAAGTGALLFVWLVEWGFSTCTALLTALLYGTCTVAWVFARMLWGLSAVGLLAIMMVWALGRSAQTDRRALSSLGWLLCAGISAALAVLFRYESLLLLVFWAALYLFLRRPFSLLPAVRRTTFFLLPLLPVLIGLLAFNRARFGALVETGYSREIAFGLSWFSLYGLSFSPGQGVFAFSPVMLLLFVGIGPARRRIPRQLLWLAAIICLSAWFFYSAWFAWGGIWNWGPRFLLTISPLLMLFVAAALEEYGDRPWFRILAGALAVAGLLFNGAGMLVDFNEYFARVTSNRDFVLNWRYFPPLAQWRIFQAGFPVDLAWAVAGDTGAIWHWRAALPAMGALLIGAGGLLFSLRAPSARSRTGWGMLLAGMVAVVALTGQTLAGYASIAKQNTAHAADAALLSVLRTETAPDDLLLISAPAYGDFQELTTRLMAYLPRSLPTYFWIEGGERGIQDAERLRVQRAVDGSGGRVWYLERWYSAAEALSPTTRWLEKSRFLRRQSQVGQSGRLSLYVRDSAPSTTVPAGVRFVGGLTLEAFTIPAAPLAAGGVVPVRLRWRAEEGDGAGPITGFVHLLAENDLSRRVAESDRFLFDGQQPDHSPLRPGDASGQGHLLSLPAHLPPGKYVLVAGLYRSQSGERLRRTDASGDDFVYLTTIQVVAPTGQ